MAARDKSNDIGLDPPADPRADYERDFYSWLMEQARLVPACLCRDAHSARYSDNCAKTRSSG
jgi:hypothetical protein